MNRLEFLGASITGLFKNILSQDKKLIEDKNIIQSIDLYTGELTTFSKIRKYHDGSQMSLSKCDGVIYRKIQNTYYKRNFSGPVNIKWFGVKGDGIADDTETFQMAINFCLQNKYDVLIEKGTFRITSTLSINVEESLSLAGRGRDITTIFFDSKRDIPALKIIGRYSGSFTITNLTIKREDNESMSSVGIYLKDVQYLNLSTIRIFRFKIGLCLLDTNSANIDNCLIHYNKVGIFGDKISVSSPNAILFQNCNIGANTETAAKIINCHNVSFNTCVFEGNGGRENLTFGAVLISFNGINGGVGSLFENCYFEGNNGEYDLKIQLNGGTGTHNISSCSFNRISNSIYTQNNILLKVMNTISRVAVSLTNNGFFTTEKYTSSLDRPTFKIETSGNSNLVEIFDVNNLFTNNIDSLKIPGIYKRFSSDLCIKAMTRLNIDGSSSLNYNIKSIEKISKSSYKILFNNRLIGQPIVTTTPIGGVCIPYVEHETLDFVIIRIYEINSLPFNNSISVVIF